MKPVLLAFAMAINATAASSAVLLVDDFSVPLEAERTGLGTAIVSDAGIGAIGDRRFTTEIVSTPSDLLRANTASAPGAGLALASAGAVNAVHEVKYGAVSGLGLDISTYTQLVFDVTFQDLAPVTFTVTLSDSLGSDSDVVTLDLTSPPTYTKKFELSNFSIDLTDLQMVEFHFDSLSGADVTIETIAFADIPLPAALPLLLSGVGVFGMLRASRKS